MVKRFDLLRLDRSAQTLRGEALHKLKFEDAFHDTLSMMALLINMTTSFSTPAEYRRLLNDCGSLPLLPKRNGTKTKSHSKRS